MTPVKSMTERQAKRMAGAKGGGYRSASSGRYVTAKYVQSNPSRVVHEASGKSGSSGPHYRSAISGRYVTTKHGKASPSTTVRER
jgi:hypothetical protein